MCLNYLEIIPPILVCLNFSVIVMIVWMVQVGALLEFSMLVEFPFLRMGSARFFLCLLLLFGDSDLILRAYLHFFL